MNSRPTSSEDNKGKKKKPATEVAIDEIMPEAGSIKPLAGTLSSSEQKELAKLEEQIRNWVDGYVPMGTFHGQHQGKEAPPGKAQVLGVYCDRVLGMSVTDSNRIIASARVMSEPNQIGSDSLPQKRSQAYELRNLEGPEKKYEAWALVLETCDPGDVTAKVICQN